jgi:hypothetical protein
MIDYIIITSIFVMGFIVTVYIFRELKVNALKDKIQELEMEILDNLTQGMQLQQQMDLLEKTVEDMGKVKK